MGLTTNSVGALFGIMGGLIQDRLYRRMAPTKGVEARLYAPMFGGVLFAIGCFITGFTAIPGVPWIASAIGQVVMIGAYLALRLSPCRTDSFSGDHDHLRHCFHLHLRMLRHLRQLGHCRPVMLA